MATKARILQLLFKIRKGFPKARAVYFLTFFIKFLPIFIITHDWNLNYGRGISSFAFHFTLGSVVNKISSKLIMGIFVFVIAIMNVIVLIYLAYVYSRLKTYGKLDERTKMKLRLLGGIIFYLLFFINQYFYMILIENFLCVGITDPKEAYPLLISYDDSAPNCRDVFNYIVMSLQSVLFFYYVAVSYIITIFTFEPFFMSNNIVVNPLSSSNIKIVCLPLIQGVIQLELHIPFRVMIFLKIINRAIFIMFYLSHIISESKNFYSSRGYYIWKNFFFSMCFVSCLIEYIFLFDYNNNLLILQSCTNRIVLKLLIEVLAAGIIMKILLIYEGRSLSDFYGTTAKISRFQYEYFNKYFQILHNADKTRDSQSLTRMIRNFTDIFIEHKRVNKCGPINGITCFCEGISIENIFTQSNSFITCTQHNQRDNFQKKPLKSCFPLYYKFLEHFILTNIEKYKGTNTKLHCSYLLTAVVFYMMFDKNFNRGLLYLEELMNSTLYKKELVIHIQVRLIKRKLVKYYRKYLLKEPQKMENLILQVQSTPQDFTDMHGIYRSINKTILVESHLKDAFQVYLDLLNKFNDTDLDFGTFFEYVTKFQDVLKINHRIVSYNYGTDKCTNPHTCAKLSVYYKFFYHEVPPALTDCFKMINENDNFLQETKYSTVILKTHTDKSIVKLEIEYASDDLCDQLGFTIDDLKHKDFHDIFPKSLSVSYNYLFLKTLKTGSVNISIPELCILDKESFAILFSLTGIVICAVDSLKIFAKMKALKKPKNKMRTKQNEIKKKKHKSTKKLILKEFRDTCFIFTKSNGKIFAISREFEKYFFLNNKIIKKLKVNLFKDLLKLENTSTAPKGRLSIRIHEIYEKIAMLNQSQMGEVLANDEFAKTYQSVKMIQSKLEKYKVDVICEFEKITFEKNEQSTKDVYLILFTLQLENKTHSPLESFFGAAFGLDSKINLLENKLASSVNFHVLPNKRCEYVNTSINLNDDSTDINKKIQIVRNLSLLLLKRIYHIEKSDIMEVECEKGDNEENEDWLKNSGGNYGILLNGTRMPQQNANEYSSLCQYTKNSKRKNKINHTMKRQMLIWIFCLVMFVTLFLVLSEIKLDLYNQDICIFKAQYYLIISRNILISGTGSALYLQFQANGLQSEIIDNGFDNSYAHHRDNIANHIEDYLNYIKLFYHHYESTRGSTYMKEIDRIFNEEYWYTVMGINKKSDVMKTNLWDTLYYLHLTANKLLYEQLDPVFYNITEGNVNIYMNEETTTYKKTDASAVFLLENCLTNIKFPLDEVLNLYPEVIRRQSNEHCLIILIFSIAISIFLLGLFILQSLVYRKINNIIFGKEYVNYNYLRYFNGFLIKKTTILRDFLDNSVGCNIVKLQYLRVTIVNSERENDKLLSIRDSLENPQQFTIKPFTAAVKIVDSYVMQGTQWSQGSPIQSANQFNFQFSPDIKHSSINPRFFQPIQDLVSRNELTTNSATGLNAYFYNKSSQTSKVLFDFKNESRVEAAMKELKVISMDDIAYKTNAKSKSKPQIQSKNVATENQVNQTNDELITHQEEPNGRHQMLRPRSFITSILVFLIVLLLICVVSFINYGITTLTINTLIGLSKAGKIIFERIGFINEMMLIYQIALLKNQDLTFAYTSHGHLKSTPDEEDLNLASIHRIFNEVASKSDLYMNGMMNLTNGNTETVLNNFAEYEKDIEAESFCDDYPKFYYANISNFVQPRLHSMKNLTADELSEQCKKIGKGFNAQGISIAFDSLINGLITMYSDFITKGAARTAEDVIHRLNDKTLLTFQVEMDYLLNKISMNYMMTFWKDYDSSQSSIVFFESIFQTSIIILIALLGMFYIWKFSLKFTREDTTINEIEEYIYNTLVF